MRARNAPEPSWAINSGRSSEWPNPGMSMATTRPTAATRTQNAAEGPRLSGYGASNSMVMSESALLSANLTRTPSQTRKYVLIVETASAPIRRLSSLNPLSTGSPTRSHRHAALERSL